MASNPGELTGQFEQNLDGVKKAFLQNISNFFFAEKELHAYFYHLCMSGDAFVYRGYCLLHAEYPSPFKFSYLNDPPYIKCEPDTSRNQRGHIDCILVNPCFVDWLLDRPEKSGMRALTGIGVKRFDLYMPGFRKTYAHFNQETGEAVFLYAVEFKFVRHSHVGRKYPLRSIHQDIAKLGKMKAVEAEPNCWVNFVEKTKGMVFIGERTELTGRFFKGELAAYDPKEYALIQWQPTEMTIRWQEVESLYYIMGHGVVFCYGDAEEGTPIAFLEGYAWKKQGQGGNDCVYTHADSRHLPEAVSASDGYHRRSQEGRRILLLTPQSSKARTNSWACVGLLQRLIGLPNKRSSHQRLRD